MKKVLLLSILLLTIILVGCEEKKIDYTEMTNMDNKQLHITNIVKNDTSYTLQGKIFEIYTLTENEVNDIVAKGMMTLDNKEFHVKSIEDDEFWVSDYDAKYGLYVSGDIIEDEIYYSYTINKISDNSYNLTNQDDDSYVWKETDIYGAISVDKSTTCEETFTGEKFSADQIFNHFDYGYYDSLYEGFSFVFDNNKCTYVYIPQED